jgi:cation diffusion facilitator family transporter
VNSTQASAAQFKRDKSITAGQAMQERSLLRAIVLDFLMISTITVAAVSSGSLTMWAEVLRGALLYSIEIITYITMWRSHRGKFVEFEYGIGKIERVITILIVGGLYFSAVYTLGGAFDRLSNPSILPTPAMMFAVVVASINLSLNLFCTGDFIRSNQTETSLILDSQIRSRLVKTIASLIVVVVVVIATWLSDPKAATLVDAAGALFAAVYMAVIGTQLLRESLPDLMDRALPEKDQLMLLKVVTRYFEDFDQFDAVRSRRSGGHAYVDLDLQFDANMPLYEVNQRCHAIQKDIVELIPDAIVAVTPRVSENWVPPGVKPESEG